MKLSEHFTLAEFTISAEAEAMGDPNTPLPEHLENLKVTAAGFEKARAILGDRAIVLTSGYRNPRVNKKVGGVRNSAHALGFAGDFRVAELPPLTCARLLDRAMRDGKIEFDQLIHETSRGIVHLAFGPQLRNQVMTQASGPGTTFVNGLAG